MGLLGEPSDTRALSRIEPGLTVARLRTAPLGTVRDGEGLFLHDQLCDGMAGDGLEDQLKLIVNVLVLGADIIGVSAALHVQQRG